MCMKCEEALAATFPDVPDADVGTFLMSVTAFPFGSAELVAAQLKELRSQTAVYTECYAIVEKYMEALRVSS